jgi:hypothetical protein
MDATIGKKVKGDLLEGAAPTLWSSVAMLTTLYHDTHSQLQDLPKLANVIRYSVSKHMSAKFDQKIASSCSDTFDKLSELKSLVVSSLGHIENGFQYETGRTDDM